jgi:hypothetical protein
MTPPGGTRTALARSLAWTCLAACLAACAATAPATAAGLSIAWTDCRPPLGGESLSRSFGCASDIAELPLFPSFSLPATMDSVYSMELVIDVDVAGADTDPLPVWWLMAPGCRTNGWAADGTVSPSCVDAWNGQGTGSFQGWLVGTPGGPRATRHGRLLVAVSTLPQDGVTLLGNASYTACRILLRTVNTSSCFDGCLTPACLVFNSLLVRRFHTPADEEILISGAESGASDRVIWQGGIGADCQAVPTRKTTWGAVKALYR